MKELKNYLQANGIKHNFVADQCGISIVTMGNYLSGSKEPKGNFLKRVTELYPIRFIYEAGQLKMELV